MRRVGELDHPVPNRHHRKFRRRASERLREERKRSVGLAHDPGVFEHAEGLARPDSRRADHDATARRSEEHTSELQSLMRISYAVFCLKKKRKTKTKKIMHKTLIITNAMCKTYTEPHA